MQKPLVKLVRPGEFVEVDRRVAPRQEGETGPQAAARRYGQPFNKVRWQKGTGAAYWTPERIAALAAENELRREK